MHGHACKQCIFQSYNASAFNAMRRFDENPSTCQCENRLKGFKFRTFIDSFNWYHGSERVTYTYLLRTDLCVETAYFTSSLALWNYLKFGNRGRGWGGGGGEGRGNLAAGPLGYKNINTIYVYRSVRRTELAERWHWVTQGPSLCCHFDRRGTEQGVSRRTLPSMSTCAARCHNYDTRFAGCDCLSAFSLFACLFVCLLSVSLFVCFPISLFVYLLSVSLFVCRSSLSAFFVCLSVFKARIH